MPSREDPSPCPCCNPLPPPAVLWRGWGQCVQPGQTSWGRIKPSPPSPSVPQSFRARKAVRKCHQHKTRRARPQSVAEPGSPGCGGWTGWCSQGSVFAYAREAVVGAKLAPAGASPSREQSGDTQATRIPGAADAAHPDMLLLSDSKAVLLPAGQVPTPLGASRAKWLSNKRQQKLLLSRRQLQDR